VKLAAISDTHIAPIGTGEAYWHNRHEFDTAHARLRQAVRLSAMEGAEVLVVTGDLSHYGDEDSLSEVIQELGNSPVGAFVVSGNHDILERQDAVSAAIARASATNVRLATRNWVPLGPTMALAGAELARRETEHWVESPGPLNLPDTRLAIWVAHFPVHSRLERFAANDLAYPGDASDLATIQRELRQLEPAVLVISGHLHARDTEAAYDLLEFSVGASIEPPFEIAIIDVETGPDEITVSVARRTLAPSRANKVPVLAPSHQRFRYSHARSWFELSV
jgi:3',5'-cyclic AMP phosphodiesterase CpdA